ncbi:MAG: amidohydrolase family protein [Candidatus Bathyarchaeia archaeon]
MGAETKIDIFAHILPPRYKKELEKLCGNGYYLKDVIDTLPSLYDLSYRFRIMDKFEGLLHVITLSLPPIEIIGNAKKAVELAKLANDEIANLVRQYPDRFVAGVASLPLLDIEASLEEIDRAIKHLKLCGILLNTPVGGKPLDMPEFFPIFEKVSQHNVPVWLHPFRDPTFAEYKSETRSKYMLFHIFGWPYETAAAMLRIALSGMLERLPNLRIITHHCGGFVPYLWERIIGAYDHSELLRGVNYKKRLKRPLHEYLRMFFYDTALYGNTPALMCAYQWCGPDHMLFGTDFPYDSEFGERYTRQTINAIEQMPISREEKELIFEKNARTLLRLP